MNVDTITVRCCTSNALDLARAIIFNMIVLLITVVVVAVSAIYGGVARAD